MSNSSATPWTVACQAPLSMGFPRQEYWSGLPFPSPGDLPDKGQWSNPPFLQCRWVLYPWATRRVGPNQGIHTTSLSSSAETKDFPGGSDGESICLQCGGPGFDPWVGKITWMRKWQPTPVFLPGMEEPGRLQSMGLQRVAHEETKVPNPAPAIKVEDQARFLG